MIFMGGGVQNFNQNFVSLYNVSDGLLYRQSYKGRCSLQYLTTFDFI